MPTLHVPAGSTDHLQRIADALWKAKKVVVITGAGISTNSGIPDFRSENGLYSMIQGQFDAAARLGAGKPQTDTVPQDEIEADNRARKRRKTSTPVEDSIEVVTTIPDKGNTSEKDSNGETVTVGENQSSDNGLIDLIAVEVSDHDRNDTEPQDEAESSTTDQGQTADRTIIVGSRIKTKDCNTSNATILPLSDGMTSLDDTQNVKFDVQEEAPAVSKLPHEDKKQDGRAFQTRTRNNRRKRLEPGGEESASPTALAAKSLDGDAALPPCTVSEHPQPRIADTITASTSIPSTPRQRALRSLIQTSASSPLSSPPSHLSDVFDEQSIDPPPSSSRPSSPVSEGEDSGAEEDEEGDNQQSLSQEQFNRASTFKRSLSTLKGRELFDSSIWADPLKTSVFYTFATNLRQKSRDASPTGCHHFISHLSRAGKMVRCYTQNIDLLEDKVGLSTRLLLGPGSRGRFSTKVAKSLAASVAARTLNNANNSSASVTPVASQETSQAVSDAPVSSQSTSGVNSQQSMVDSDAKFDDESQGLGSVAAQGDEDIMAPDLEGDQQIFEGPGKDDTASNTRPAEAQTGDASSPADKPSTKAESGLSTPEPNKGVECVFLHGSLRALRCFQCGCVADWDEGDRELQTMSGQQPPCPRCEHATVARQERGKRALGVGKLRPDVVLYGEEHPESHRISTIIQHDIALAPDMLIVMGTSLKVHGLKTVVREFAKTVHNRKDGKVIFVNYTKPADSVWADVFDFWIEMDCDAWVEDLKEKKPIMWLPPGSVEDDPKPARKRRPAKDEAEKKDSKRPKKTEEEPPEEQVEIPPAVVTAVVADASADVVAEEQNKKPNKARLKNPKKEEPSDDKKSVPKRPAAFRDCRQNAVYWVTKIRTDLAKISGRELEPYPPSQPSPMITADVAATPPVTTAAAEKSPAALEAVRPKRRPRTKNTKSRLDPQGASKTGQQTARKSPKPTRAPTKPKAGAKAKKEHIRGSSTLKLHSTSVIPIPQPPWQRFGQTTVFPPLIKQEGNETSPHNPQVLNEVPIPNTSLNKAGESNSIVNAVKSNHRIRKPKAIFGEASSSDQPPRREAPVSNSKMKMAKFGSFARRSKVSTQGNAVPQAQVPTAGVDVTGRVMLPIPNPQPAHLSAAAMPSSASLTPVERIVLAPIRTVHHERKNSSFLQLTLGPSQQSPHGPAPSYLEPLVSTGPPQDMSSEMSPILSPGQWRNRAFEYVDTMARRFSFPRRSLDYPIQPPNGPYSAPMIHGRSSLPPAPGLSPRVPFLSEAPSLLTGRPVTQDYSSPPNVTGPAVPDDSPNRQLHLESEAAMTLSQMRIYDPRKFART
ncbi:hypothetical protein BD289DRAFT_295481 [Coniella lustricola]|uniref:Deacetylase sirtuin-type domain-containing protein n=1 Tax=Coniella lustricola TaxID=2025994 RepID=A0A2T3A4T6_9PEZI|nr:hypothetical protein BD289DRAFT_295481 [Coniella lustricola]